MVDAVNFVFQVQTSSKRGVHRVPSDRDEDPAAYRCGALPGGPETGKPSSITVRTCGSRCVTVQLLSLEGRESRKLLIINCR